MKKEATPKNANGLIQKTSDRQNFSTTSKVIKPEQQLKRSIITIPLNLSANVQYSQRRRHHAWRCGTLALIFFVQKKQRTTESLKGGAQAPREAAFGNQTIEYDGHTFPV
jgi:hypothetical protein